MKVKHELNKRQEKRTWFGKLEIMKMSAVWLVITLSVTAMLFIASRLSAKAVENQRKITEKTIRCVGLAEEIQSGSDILTNAVWRFAATGKTRYAREYLEEKTETLTRDKAIEGLRKEGLLEEELETIELAKSVSDNLMEQELHCIRLIYEAEGIQYFPEEISEVELTHTEKKMTSEDKRKKANQFVFGSRYEATKDVIKENINLFTSALYTRQKKELAQAMRRTDSSQLLQQVTAIMLLIWCLGFMVFFYMALIRPIHYSCMELKVSRNKNHKLTLRGPLELRSLIIAFNDALTRIQYKNQEILDIQMVDPITGGFTSTRFDLEVERFLQENREFAFVSLDIRRFKLINDVYGSEAGNQVLKAVYDAILRCMEQEECVSRIQADMFNFVLFEMDEKVIEQRIEAIHQTLIKKYHEKKVVEGENSDYHLSVNCGVYQVQKKDRDIVTIRDRANVARKMNRDEAEYLEECVFFTDLERQKLLREQILENEMEHALENEEFLVYLQPKVRLSDKKIAGAEALVRWNSTTFGLIPPNEFIPLFEKNGFIKKLDYYMFTQVCRIIRGWIDSGKNVVPVSVNLSRKHMNDEGVIKRFQNIQKEYKIPCELIEFELTEAFVFEDLKRFKSIIGEIQEAGYKCSMDDFGSGYSSLNVLKEIPVDILKLDRGFFVGGDIERGDTERGTNVVKAVIRMAKELNMEVVAEGIETWTLVEFLKEQGCDMVQGYIFYRPMPVADFERRVLHEKEDKGDII
ncbi:MAG: bifunctional diguanylate cyclase/phosphodiesterase [Faecalicatena sp.]|uniref:putative bifunctional diguanylate cyclase/phosphodiesterase n=1 Tax=Faecalicatena sp. TaxID=2005360 RepID=UPI00258CA0B0|nr:bifunctional diguanylate cyclase/phosphodiesterase [Faecalicatena sp.]MCI6467359.1 bifunctional diguanylate cyclase/phosphodiesterase [Faecalicatena sp.]MDY5621045.1 bifunctional diguanylate cyclase/phosphodiesterase [Lachnospiraceae bacterium]